MGSKAVRESILAYGPALSLHGHIHESPAISGIWKAEIGETICVQPGQMKANALSYALIDLESMEMERVEAPL